MNQGVDNNVLDLVKQRGCYPYEYMSDFEEFKATLLNKEKCYSSITDRKIRYKEHEHVPSVWNKSKMKTMKDYHDLYLKCDVLLSANVFE